MIKYNKTTTLLVLLAIFIASSCSKETKESSRSIQERILKSYIKTNYGETISPTKSGLYIVENNKIGGDKIGDSTFAFVRYSIRNLEGKYLSTTYDSVAILLGQFSKKNYYGDLIWCTKDLTPGVKEILDSMMVGGRSKSIIPPWLLNLETGDYIADGDGISKIYDIELTKNIKDIDKYQYDNLEQFALQNYEGLDSTQLGFYYKLLEKPETKDTIPEGRDVLVWYVGKYLDGQVFDTNIADTAKKYNIFSGSESNYTALTVQFYKDEKTALEKNSAVDGFVKAVIRMNFGERAITFFNSVNGYGSAGSIKSSGEGIPPYTPLFFDITIKEDTTD